MLQKSRNTFNLLVRLGKYRTVKTVAQGNISQPERDPEWDNAKSYDQIPGIQSFSELRNFLPGGKLYNLPAEKLNLKICEEYGPIFMIKGFLRRPDVLLIFDPVDFEKLFRTEGVYPTRLGLQTLAYYRHKVRPDVYGKTGGLLSERDKKWYDFRTVVNPVMLQPKIVKQYVVGIDEIAIEFIDKIRRDRNEKNEIGDRMILDIGAWALESIAFIALDTRLNVIASNDTTSDGYHFVKCARQIMYLSYKLEGMPSLWNYITTPNLVKLMKSYDFMTHYTLKYIDQAMAKITQNEKENKPIVESVLQKLLKVDKSIAFVMASDMLLAGAETTGALTTALFYVLGTNPDKQQKLREEILKILPNKDSRLKPDDLNNIPYLRAFIKETLRLHTVIFGTAREAGYDLVFKGYQVPKGTNIVAVATNLYKDANYYPKPEQFLPERWLRSEIGSDPALKLTNPFVYLPFGYGVRSCIGRRFAELEMECLVARLVRNFEISWNLETKLKHKTDFVNSPVPPVKFGFKDLDY